jgi:hypothetical protein
MFPCPEDDDELDPAWSSEPPELLVLDPVPLAV